MARTLTAASTHYYSSATIPKTAPPFTLAAWVKLASIGAIRHVFYEGSGGSQYTLRVTAANKGEAQQFDGATNGLATGTVNFAAGTWAHLCGTWTSNSSRTVFTNGADKTNNATVVGDISASATQFKVGANLTGAAADLMNGDLAEAAAWDVVLDDSEIAALAAGVSPRLIRPQSLLAYWPLFGNVTNEPDYWRNSNILTPTNTPAKADHPRMFYASGWGALGTPARIVAQAVSGVLSTSGVVVKQVSKSLAGTLTTAGSVATAHIIRLFRDSVMIPISGFMRYMKWKF